MQHFDPITAGLLICAGVVGYVAVLQVIAWRSHRAQVAHVWSALWCCAGVALIAGHLLQHNETTAELAITGSRMRLAAGALLGAFSVGGARAAGATLRPAFGYPIALVLGFLLALVAMFTPWIASEAGDVRVDMFGGTVLEPRHGPLFGVEIAYLGLVAVYLMRVARPGTVAADRESKRTLRALAVLFVPLVGHELAYATHLINTVSLFELGVLAGAVMMNHALTARSRRLEQVRAFAERSEASFHKLVQGSRDGILVHREGHVLIANGPAAALLGRADPAVLAGTALSALVAPDEHGRHPRFSEAPSLSAGSAPRIERFVRPGGETVRLEVTRLPIIFDGLPATVSILTDIAAREAWHARTRFVEEVLTAQDEERRRIARELHDEAGQALTSVLVGLRELEETTSEDGARTRARRLQRVTQSTLDDLGRLARGLHPQLIEDLGFTAAVTRHAAEQSELHGIEIDVEVVGAEPAQLSRTTATALYRVMQEALTNSIRHGSARHVSLVLHAEPSSLQISVEDDGQGFDAELPVESTATSGLGLQGIRERIALLGGTLQIESAPGCGTTLIARVPLGPEVGHA